MSHKFKVGDKVKDYFNVKDQKTLGTIVYISAKGSIIVECIDKTFVVYTSNARTILTYPTNELELATPLEQLL